MKSTAATVGEYLESLPPDRREMIDTLRDTIVTHLPEGYEEMMQYGMIGYAVPLERYPDTYNGHPLGIVALASQKRYVSLYLMGIYGDPGGEAWIREAFERAGKRLDMGKSCVRFKRLDDVPLEVIGEAVARLTVEDFIALYEASRR